MSDDITTLTVSTRTHAMILRSKPYEEGVGEWTEFVIATGLHEIGKQREVEE